MGWKVFYRASEMRNTKGGKISSSLLSLQLQLKTILEEAGGEHALTFLDLLADLNRSEQALVLRSFSRTLRRVMLGEVRLSTMEDARRKEFEDGLYNQIVEAFENENKTETTGGLRVLDGGLSSREQREPAATERTLRIHNKEKPLLN